MGLLKTYNVVLERMSSYSLDISSKETRSSLFIKKFYEKHYGSRVVLLLFVLLGTSMVIGDGILTPTMSGLCSKFLVNSGSVFLLVIPILYTDHITY